MSSEAVSARRVGTEQFFVLRVEGDERVWHTRQFAFKPRRNQPVSVPYWYEEGKTWHLWAGAEKKESPPLDSFATMGEVRARVAELAASGG